MRYGYFDDARREYVITDPRTPTKWINYIGTIEFGGFVDNTGGVLLCKGDPTENRITKYIQQMPSGEFKGSTLYLRVGENDSYRLLSPFFVPGLEPLDRYECHVGLGYTTIVSEISGLRTEVTIFVPRGASCELRSIRITNIADRALEVDTVPVVEYTHPRALLQFTNADWVPQTVVSRLADERDGMKVVAQYPFMYRDTRINYFTSNVPMSSFETDRKRFLGENEYGTWARPLSLNEDELANYEAKRGDNIIAALHHLGRIGPGETMCLVTQLGQAASIEAAMPQILRYRAQGSVGEALGELADFWGDYLGRMHIKTPDASMDHMLNVHNARQCYVTMNWSRYLSYYQLGLGSRGIGFRDSAQDALGVFAGAPAEGKDLVTMLLGIQRANGSAYHQLNPLTGEASIGEAGEYGCDGADYYGDDHLWAVLAVCEYLKETGDYGYLDEVVPYYAERTPRGKRETGTVLDHLDRAIDFTTRNTGAHGLPLLGYADWNDCVNLALGAESLFIANLYGRALLEMIALCEYRGEGANGARYREYYDTMKSRVNEHAWDGAWYVRYFDKCGEVLGASRNSVCRIYANGQSWPVLSGFAPRDRAVRALDSVREHLNTTHGIKIATPGYNGFVEGVGGIATYPPGAKENCGIFLHTNPWVIIAETIVGRGERAFEYYRQINPAAKNDAIEVYEIEPYVYAQNILGDEHAQFGLGRNSWLSGTASWTYQAGTKFILGVRPEHGGLRIDPCIPPHWEGFTVRRAYRGAWYAVSVANPEHVSKGVAKVTVDGKVIEGSVVPAFGDGAEHAVGVVMGETGRSL